MTLAPIFDREGQVAGWFEADRLYSPTGSVVGWQRDGAVYASDGSHVGWLERGQFRDAAGCVVAWVDGSLGRPEKPAAEMAGRGPVAGPAPTRPSFSRRMGRVPFVPQWSTRDWHSYLG